MNILTIKATEVQPGDVVVGADKAEVEWQRGTLVLKLYDEGDPSGVIGSDEVGYRVQYPDGGKAVRIYKQAGPITVVRF